MCLRHAGQEAIRPLRDSPPVCSTCTAAFRHESALRSISIMPRGPKGNGQTRRVSSTTHRAPGRFGGTEPGQKSALSPTGPVFGELSHFRCPSIREISSAVGDRFFTRRGGLFSVELIIGGVLFIGTLRRTRLPFPSRMFEILVCAMTPALEQNTTLAVRRVSFMPCPS